MQFDYMIFNSNVLDKQTECVSRPQSKLIMLYFNSNSLNTLNVLVDL